MGIRRATVAALLATGLALAGTGCEITTDNEGAGNGSSAGSGDGGGASPDASDAPADAGGEKDGDKDGAKDADAAGAELPRLVGQGLRSAQEAAKKAGFRKVRTHDALGRDRAQAFNRNWQVCFQKPAAGTHPTDTEVDLGTVKLDEECPDQDNRPEKAGGTMPDFTGKSLRAARGALDASTSITTKDASGEDRLIFLESNWQVCSQDPAPGSKLEGRPVTLNATKFDQSCP